MSAPGCPVPVGTAKNALHPASRAVSARSHLQPIRLHAQPLQGWSVNLNPMRKHGALDDAGLTRFSETERMPELCCMQRRRKDGLFLASQRWLRLLLLEGRDEPCRRLTNLLPFWVRYN
jgi:hypothetical protein